MYTLYSIDPSVKVPLLLYVSCMYHTFSNGSGIMYVVHCTMYSIMYTLYSIAPSVKVPVLCIMQEEGF